MNTAMFFTYFPQIHTAIAEWLACLIFMLPLPRRLRGVPFGAACMGFLTLLLVTNVVGERMVGLPWLLLMLSGLGGMLLMIVACCRVKMPEAMFNWAYAFILAEFAASLEWQINYYLMLVGVVHTMGQTYICMAVIYAASYGLMAALNRRGRKVRERMKITWREAVGAMAIALGAFAISNFTFAFTDNVISESLGAGILYVRTVVDLAGLIMLYAQVEQRREMNLRFELDAMESLFNRQYEQYQQYQASNEEMHRVYHDLKHQIAYLESERDAQKRASYLAEMKEAIEAKDAAVNTNNSVLDTLLTSKNLLCIRNGIIMRCYADAEILSFLDAMDTCAIFGNAMDNAIECELKVAEKEKRLISVDVYQENGFAVIRVANYCEDPVAFRDELPVTTKADRSMHGYGVKSIKRVVEKYRGHVTLGQEEGWFIVKALIPIPPES